MNNDCLFSVSLYCQLTMIIKCLLINTQSNKLHSNYLWKLLNIRNYKNNKMIKNNYYDNCELYNFLEYIDSNFCFILVTPIYSLDYHYNNNNIGYVGDQLTIITRKFGQLINLNKLRLSHNDLISIPGELGLLVNLHELRLDNNKLISLPTELGQLLNLYELWLSGNNLHFIPSQFCQLINLKVLDLTRNELEIITIEFSQLINLSTLYLRDNKLKITQNKLNQLTNLKLFINYL